MGRGILNFTENVHDLGGVGLYGDWLSLSGLGIDLMQENLLRFKRLLREYFLWLRFSFLNLLLDLLSGLSRLFLLLFLQPLRLYQFFFS